MFTLEKITQITHSYRNIKRFRQIVNVLLKYGFKSFLEVINVNKFGDSNRKEIHAQNNAVRVRMALAELGPTFIKLGQILATRPDLVPHEYTVELAKLQDDAPTFPYADVEKIILEDTGKYPKDIFDSFDEEPLAAASIGQVHRAVYKGNQVVVKVQRPGIEKIIATDLEIMYHFALLMEKHIVEIQIQKPSAIIKEFTKSIEKEVDFKIEARQTERFAEAYIEDKTTYTPKIFNEVSTTKIMVIEYIDGVKASDVEALKEQNYDLKLLAHNGTESLLKQIFENGYFHGDPHPGNIIIMPGNIVCFIDYGMMGNVSIKERQNFADLLMQIITRKTDRIVSYILRFTKYEVEPDHDELERDMGEIIDEFLDLSLKYMNFGVFVEHMMDILSKHHLRLLPNLFMMLKALVSLEDLGKKLNPDLEILTLATPYVKRIYMEKFNLKKMAANMIDPLHDLMNLANELPEDVRTLLKQLKKGKIKIELEYLGINRFRNSIVKISNRIVVAIVLAALIVGHSLIMLTKQPPGNGNIRLIGMIGFTISVILGFILVISILFERNK